jgi:hypothetical protein
MGIFAWLFGSNVKTSAATPAAKPEPAAAEKSKPVAPAVRPEVRKAVASEADNVQRWRESGQARAWVEARRGRWNHTDWLALLDQLRRSPFWPMQADAVGLVLEDEKRRWVERN